MAPPRLFPQLILVSSKLVPGSSKTHPRLIQNFSSAQLDLSPTRPNDKTLLHSVKSVKTLSLEKEQSDFIVPHCLFIFLNGFLDFPV